jgi:hypothetical protein
MKNNTIWAPGESRITWNGFADGGRHNAPAAVAPPDPEYINKAIVGLTGSVYDKAKAKWFPDLDDDIAQAKREKKAKELGIPINKSQYYKDKLKTTTDPEQIEYLKKMILEEEGNQEQQGFFESIKDWNPFT